MYSSPCSGSIRQSDIIGPVQVFEFKTAAPSASVPAIDLDLKEYQYAAILSQDCDLEQDCKTREANDPEKQDKLLSNIILCGVYKESVVMGGEHRAGAKKFSKSKEWKQVEQNKDPRYQYLGYVPGPNCILVADFKDYFFVPVKYLYEQINQGKILRMASMNSPWRDHLLQRFGFYMTRIGLPKDFNALGPPPPA